MADFFVQPAKGLSTNTTSPATGAFPSNVTAGNLIVVGVISYTATTTVTVTDSLGNTYAQIGSYVTIPGTGGVRSSMWYAKNVTGGACTITVTPNQSAYQSFMAGEYSGANANPLDGSSSNPSSGGADALVTTGSVAVSGSNELIVAFVADFTFPFYPVAPMKFDAVWPSLNPAIGGSPILMSGVVSAAKNVTVNRSASGQFGAHGASFTGSFAPVGGAGGAIVIDD